jgi:glycyl-tRNA synthetase alpha chain
MILQAQNVISFENIILSLKSFWQQNNCTLIEGFDLEVGAGTLAPITATRILGKKQHNICQVQCCRRPTDGRFAQNPNRLGSYYQMQVILKPAPDNIQQICIESLNKIGLQTEKHDIRFIEDDWQNPSIGASGLGYELWCDGMEVLQFTYMQKIGGVEVDIVAGEITYGLERIAMYVQNVNNIFDIIWSNSNPENIVKYGDIHTKDAEIDNCTYYRTYTEDTEFLYQSFLQHLKNAKTLHSNGNFHASYEQCLKASHSLNILDARGYLSQNKRMEMIMQIREMVKNALESIAKQQK